MPGVPPDAAKLADEIRLATVLLVAGRVDPGRTAPGQWREAGGERGDILVVVVDVVDIRYNMDIAAGVDDRARAVQGFRDRVDRGENLAVLADVGFVERAPADDRWVADVSVKGFQPFRQKALQTRRTADIQAPTGMLAPDQVAQPVRPVQEAFLKDFLVQPCPVESERHGALDVAPEFVVRWCGVDAVRIEALVENQALEERFAIQQHGLAVPGDRAQPEIACQPVGGRSAGQAAGQVVERGVPDLPGMCFGQTNG